MFERGISVAAVRDVLESGEVIERYPEDDPYPSRLVLGWHEGRALHVVASDNKIDDEIAVVTVYEPDSAVWESGYKRRRKP